MSRWLILRTSGGQTLPLAASLAAAGFDVWTPARTLRRYVPAKTPNGKRLVEHDVPILPTFLFARAAQLDALARAAASEASPHPAFSVFRHGGRVPLVGDGEVQGLRDEETEQAALIQSMRDAESRAEAAAIRIAAIKSASARRRAEEAQAREVRAAEAAAERERLAELRAQRLDIEPGSAVEVVGIPSFVGIVGVLEGVEGHYASVKFGSHSWKIEGWQVMPTFEPAPRSIAA